MAVATATGGCRGDGGRPLVPPTTGAAGQQAGGGLGGASAGAPGAAQAGAGGASPSAGGSIGTTGGPVGGGAGGLGGGYESLPVPRVCPTRNHTRPDSSVPAACAGPLDISAEALMPPAAAGQPYVRCGTIGPDNGWRVTLSPDGRYLAALTSTGTFRLLSTSDWTEVAQFASPVGVLDALAFSADSTTLATWSAEPGVVALWGVSDGCLLRTFVVAPHAASYAQGALAFSPDGQALVVGPTLVLRLDTPARLWVPPVNPKLPIDLESETRAVTFVASGTRLMTYSQMPAGNAGWVTQLW
ncbi:MAG TPA: WD40 repeat domain-containing protein, partial [Polyangia bacterium]|nr:WD40 repeat domain-containing protein [Polyangia bacterium]